MQTKQTKGRTKAHLVSDFNRRADLESTGMRAFKPVPGAGVDPAANLRFIADWKATTGEDMDRENRLQAFGRAA